MLKNCVEKFSQKKKIITVEEEKESNKKNYAQIIFYEIRGRVLKKILSHLTVERESDESPLDAERLNFKMDSNLCRYLSPFICTRSSK